MNIIGHLLIAESVRKMLLRQTGTRLSRAGFLYGNILPDLSGRYDGHPHFFNRSFGFVLDALEKLETDLETHEISSFFYSRDAGVIAHYLSDFFCYAHSEHCPYGIYRHHLYELSMLRQFRNGLLFCTERRESLRGASSPPEAYIRRRMNEHDRTFHDKKQDFYFALTVSSRVVLCAAGRAPAHGEDRLPDGPNGRAFALR